MATAEIWVLINELLAKRWLIWNAGRKQVVSIKRIKTLHNRDTSLATQSLLTSAPQSDFCMCSRARAISHANDDLAG